MPSPKPEPAPVTIATFRSSLMAGRSSVLDRHSLQRGEAQQARPTLLATVAAAAHAAERQLDAAARAVIVDEDLPRAQGLREAQLTSAVARPHARDEPVGRAVGERDRLRLAV